MNQRNKNIAVRAVSMALLGLSLLMVAACGGGGGGGASGGGGGGTLTAGWVGGASAKPETGQYIEFLVGGQRTDPLNLSGGETVTAVVANYDALGTRTVLSGSTFSLSGGGGLVTLDSGGVITVSSASAPKFTVTAHYTLGAGALTITQDGRASSGSSVVNGTVVGSDLTTPVPYLQIEFYDSSGALVGAGLTDGSGQFHAATSPNAVSLGINSNSVTNGYFRAVRYNSHIYSTTGTACPIKLTGLVSGSAFTLPSTIVLVNQTSGPPPPPDACGK